MPPSVVLTSALERSAVVGLVSDRGVDAPSALIDTLRF